MNFKLRRYDWEGGRGRICVFRKMKNGATAGGDIEIDLKNAHNDVNSILIR
jgi:hypothetical protein